MLPRERIDCALHFEQPDRPPHFEQVFALTQEAFGLSMPEEEEIAHAKGTEQLALFERCAHIYALTIRRFRWDALLVWRPAMVIPVDQPDHPGYAFIPFVKEYLRNFFGHDIPVGAFVWQSFVSLEVVKDYMEFSVALLEEPETIDAWALDMYTMGLLHTQRLLDAGADFINVNSDHAFNGSTFLRPQQFRRFVYPYKKALVEYIHSRGAWVLMHSDGNLMAILDQILDIRPDVLQSIDPMAGMDIREVKRLCRGRMGLMGNVQCSLLQDGPPEAIIASADYCLTHGSPGGGYIYSTSNTVFEGIPLENYQLMVDYFHDRFPLAGNPACSAE
jgi:uroporphyrinogen decarboxylase